MRKFIAIAVSFFSIIIAMPACAYQTEEMKAPIITSVSVDNYQITVEWEATYGAEKYMVFRKDGDGSWTPIGFTIDTKYVDDTAEIYKEYAYSVCAYKGDRKSKFDEVGITAVCVDDDIINFAKSVYEEAVDKKMTDEEKLNECFEYIGNRKKFEYSVITVPSYHESDWADHYVLEMKEKTGSDCFGFTALFAYLASLAGFDEVYVCSTEDHAWTVISGLIYDPSLLKDSENSVLMYGETLEEAEVSAPTAGYTDLSELEGTWQCIKIPRLELDK